MRMTNLGQCGFLLEIAGVRIVTDPYLSDFVDRHHAGDPSWTRNYAPPCTCLLYTSTGGGLRTRECDQKEYTYMSSDGVDNCIAALKDIEAGGLHKCFIEMNACAGGCVNGPVMEKYHCSPLRDYARVNA